MTTLNSFFSTIYGRQPNALELQRLATVNVDENVSLHRTFRNIIGHTDRQSASTPFLVRFDADDITYFQFPDFELALDKADLAVAGDIMNSNGYEPHLSSFFRRTILPGMSVIDAGANIGHYTMLSSVLVGPEGRVTAFEPNTENCRLILLSINRNKSSNIKLLPVALSTSVGYTYFSSFIGSNGGILPSTEDTLASPQCTIVPTFTLDGIVDGTVNFLKMDTEGAEGLIVKGAHDTIRRERPIISTEFSPEMLSRVSGVSPLDYLGMFQSWEYNIYMLGRTSGSEKEEKITDIDSFMASYGSPGRIEDIVLFHKDAKQPG